MNNNTITLFRGYTITFGEALTKTDVEGIVDAIYEAGGVGKDGGRGKVYFRFGNNDAGAFSVLGTLDRREVYNGEPVAIDGSIVGCTYGGHGALAFCFSGPDAGSFRDARGGVVRLAETPAEVVAAMLKLGVRKN